MPDDESLRIPTPAGVIRPTHRALRGFAIDPSLATELDTAPVSEVTYRVPWEEDLQAGPVGEYVEIVDYDPASGCFYEPVDLNHPYVLAGGGLAPSEGSPQFHPQMVYAVVMTTIDRFERALGRKAFWADRVQRGANGRGVRRRNAEDSDSFVRKLRIYPHALREANAYYSRDRIGLLFGYFPASDDRRTGLFPGGMVFTCLSHDIIAHETTHALLDGFHEYLFEPTNPDVLAFHEAFADIVALFQHFSFPEILAHQILRTSGDLSSENLLGQLATQFGRARGGRTSLRDAIGSVDEEGNWTRRPADPTELDRTPEVHDRGAILVAAVFDAFLSIYRIRSADVRRLADKRAADGSLDPALADLLAREAAKAAAHVLDMCIRALDYCPPIDLTFGEYLRALITADMDVMPVDKHRYRVAFIDAFRGRGIYPDGIRTLSEESLRWSPPTELDARMSASELEKALTAFVERIRLRGHLDRLRRMKSREEIWRETKKIQAFLHETIPVEVEQTGPIARLLGLGGREDDLGGFRIAGDVERKFRVFGFRESRRQKDDGRAVEQVFISLVRKYGVIAPGESEASFVVRVGSTIVFDLTENRIAYIIRKGLGGPTRLRRRAAFEEGRAGAASLAAAYFHDSDEPFAALHCDPI
jgi:hypothetical protein